MAVQKKSEKRIKKENYWKRLQVVAQKYNNVMFVDADNVSSQQMQHIRVKLRKINAIMIMGKNVSLNLKRTPLTAKITFFLLLIKSVVFASMREFQKSFA
jgi:hypothetical protein